ncbi:alpha-2-antiplasmin isoform X2 [Ornithorhynchus anatinus]|uniref:alpha-2-antiplasmin isoform X2 n=1 Tax=Ornithorhynchus anatinus TaxID=9258 RepID=UPI0010A7553C|nr:alpha-2-antiplasmin isoform X2 [Ornithorhynchus anatinus]
MALWLWGLLLISLSPLHWGSAGSSLPAGAVFTPLPNSGVQDSTFDTRENNSGSSSPLAGAPLEETDSGPGPGGPDGAEEVRGIGSPGAKEANSCAEAPSPKRMRKLAAAMMKFTADLFGDVLLKSDRPNVVLSPLSVALALSHLTLGAGNRTEKKLLEVLHTTSVPCLPDTLNRVRVELGRSVLKLAARMYLEKGFPIKEEFLEKSERFFGAKPYSLTGNNEEDLRVINKWVKEVTSGKIERFLSDLPPRTVLLLLNAVHFQGFWRTKFDPTLTKTDVFHLDEQFTVPVQMMKAQRLPLSWLSFDELEVQVARIPFKSNVSFVVVIPNKFEWNISQVLVNLSQAILHQSFPRERPTDVKVPKLHLDHQLDLSATLSHLGLQELFQGPDLSKISEQNLVVTSIQHQATLELNEEGVEASAATSISMSRMSAASFRVNRPFLFFIFEDTTGLPLFVGSVKNPNPSAQPERKEQQDSPDEKSFFDEKYSPPEDFYSPGEEPSLYEATSGPK